MHRDQILKELTKFNFTEPLARLYLAGLELGPALMAPLARKAGVKRTSAYYLMEELLRRTFFTTKQTGRRTYYVAASPQQLLEMTLERERRVRKLFPALKSIASKKL